MSDGPFTPTTDQVRDCYRFDPMDDYYDPVNAGANAEGYGRAFDRWLSKIKADAIRSARDELGVDISDNEGDWWDGYRQGQRRQFAVLAEYADRIEKESTK